jgi:hypothetical protein
MVANFWLRSGDAYTANNFQAFLEETLSFFQEKKIELLHLDSGFFSGKIFDYLEEEGKKTGKQTILQPFRCMFPFNGK